ncbi:MAG: dethiobiotin synthase [Planctomycetes bacterium]|nr:dethiobiotin synthase [Planctomycetota bacterium]
MSSLDQELLAEQHERRAAGLWRDDSMFDVAPGVDFGSNDYLGLARDPAIVAAMARGVREFGAGGRSARLLAGGSPLHSHAERAVAAWLQAEAALLFPSGYQANVGLIGALVGPGDAIVSDRDIHASSIDGARLSRARVFVHAHGDLVDLEHQLARAQGARRVLVLTEGLFSMGGDRVPLAAIDALCAQYGAWLVVDEAHSIGLLGPDGAGAWADEARGVGRVVARIVTGGKALGVGGAFVVGSHALRAHLVNHARSFLFTTAPPPAVAAGLLAAVERCRGARNERTRLLGLARRLAERLELPVPAGAIVPFPVGDSGAAVALAAALRDQGFYVPAVRPPTVAKGRAMLRIVCHATHSDAQVDRLVELLRPHAPSGAVLVPAGRAPATRAGKALVVVGTDTGVGKTVASALLLRAALRAGRDVAYWKPVQTGDDDDTATVGALANAPAGVLLANAVKLPLPASPHAAAAAAGVTIEVDDLLTTFAAHRRTDQALLVELAGGLLVPLTLTPRLVTQADWLERSGADVVLVARAGLGTLNHTLLTVEALRRRGLTPRALLLVGESFLDNAATLRRLVPAPVFEVPPFAPLTAAAIDAFVQAHELGEVWR